VNETAGRTIEDLRNRLWEGLDQLRAGESTPQIANALAHLSGQYLSTYKLQLEYARLTGTIPNIPLLGAGSTTATAAE
jgi:hypothetical protein